MIRYYCDRCDKEIKPDQYESTPFICDYKEESSARFGVIDFKMKQSDCKLCVDCMRKYIKFMRGAVLK